MFHDGPSIIDVRFAGYRCCSANLMRIHARLPSTIGSISP
jgi:hypothetical protein